MLRTTAILCAVFVTAIPVQATSITEALKGADAVVVATESNEAQLGNQIVFSLDIERTFTGPVLAGQIVRVRTPLQRKNPARLAGARGYRGVWFLKATGVEWEATQVWHQGNGPISAAYFRYPIGTGPLPVALTYATASTPVADQILLEMAAGDFDGRPDMIMDASGDMSSPALQRALHYLADSGASDAALVALAALVGHGDTASLLRIEKIAQSLTDNKGGSGHILSAIRNFRLTDPEAVACLGRIATNTSDSLLLRNRAAHALYAIHSVDAVPWLGKLLNDQSDELKLIGAMGMSFFANGVGIPTPETMRTLSHLNQRSPSQYRTTETSQHVGYTRGEERVFVEYWTLWWNQHQELKDSN